MPASKQLEGVCLRKAIFASWGVQEGRNRVVSMDVSVPDCPDAGKDVEGKPATVRIDGDKKMKARSALEFPPFGGTILTSVWCMHRVMQTFTTGRAGTTHEEL
eukprot:scaffold1603_cov415-Prasinococcus_capsulatus_cf.AAC.16